MAAELPDHATDRGAGNGAPVVLRCEGIVKWFGGVQSLDGVSLSVHAGEVVALCGDNGAGKSTLVKTLSGIHRPDAGQIWLGDEPLSGLSPPLARELGIETVHQDLALCDNLDAVANVVLGQEPVRFRIGPIAFRNERAAVRIAKQRLDEVGIAIKDFDASVRRLSGGQRQAIAIARAMMHAKRVMMLDEPTAALGMQQTETTLEVIRSVARQGLGVIVISHSIDDIFAVADRIVVLRLGRVILDTPISETTQDEVVAHITGSRMRRR
ncbi:MAG TPA: ATP-binding cassette domain-containing protein [Gaiellales bacterium]